MRKTVVLGIILSLAFFQACKQKNTSTEAPSIQIGSPAPEFEIQDINGKTYTLSAYKGKVVLLEFFATWCEPCRSAVPDLDRLYDRFKSRDFVFLAVAVDEGSDITEVLRKFGREKKIHYPLAPDMKKISDLYNVNGIPSSFIIDKEGSISFYHVGFTPDTYEILVKEIEGLLEKHA